MYRTLFTSPPRPTSRTHQPLGATTARTQTTAHYTISQCPKMPVISTTSDDLGSSNQLRYLTPGYHKRLGTTSSTRKSPDSLGLELRSCPRCSQTQSLIQQSLAHTTRHKNTHTTIHIPKRSDHTSANLLLNDPTRAPKNKLAQNKKLNTRKRPPLISPSSPSSSLTSRGSIQKHNCVHPAPAGTPKVGRSRQTDIPPAHPTRKCASPNTKTELPEQMLRTTNEQAQGLGNQQHSQRNHSRLPTKQANEEAQSQHT